MKRALEFVLLAGISFALTVIAMPALGWTAETGAAVLEAGAEAVAGTGAVSQAQAWLDFICRNGANLAALVGVVGGIALAIRAQVHLWRADAAGEAVTSAVTRARVEGLVRPIMAESPKGIRAVVKRWAAIK